VQSVFNETESPRLLAGNGQEGPGRLRLRPGQMNWASEAKPRPRPNPGNPEIPYCSPDSSWGWARAPEGQRRGRLFFPHRGVDCPPGGPSCAISWPIIPIHMALLPDGRVMSYGTDKYGSQGAQLYYDVWDPKLGTDPITSHQILPNTTKTDIFCGGGSLDRSYWLPKSNWRAADHGRRSHREWTTKLRKQ
jgi:hypothetical protein